MEPTAFMLDFVRSALHPGGSPTEVGRASCSPQERALGQSLATAWSGFGYSVAQEAFSCAPRAFFGVIPLAVLCYWRAARRLFAGAPAGGLAILLPGLLLLWLELVRYREVVDSLGFPFTLQTGYNVVATLPPLDGAAPARRLILSAHLDSAREFTAFHYLGPSLAPAYLRLCVAALAALLAACGAGARGVPAPGSRAAASLRAWGHPALAALGVALLPLVFFTSSVPVPGAADNLSGLAVLHALGRDIAAAGGGNLPSAAASPAFRGLRATTEVVLLATSSEEAGLRGAKRYAARHAAAHAALPTAVLVLECAAVSGALSVVASEPWPGAVHDPVLVAALVAAGGPALRLLPALPVGATDAAAFTRAGVPAAALQALLDPNHPHALPRTYHTRADMLAALQPRAMGEMYGVAAAFAARYGEVGLLPQPQPQKPAPNGRGGGEGHGGEGGGDGEL